jgi:general secretion pathway protein D
MSDTRHFEKTMKLSSKRRLRKKRMSEMRVTVWMSVLCGVLLSGQAMAQDKGYDPFEPQTAKKAAENSPAVGVIASVEFVDTPITSIFKMISDLTGWSVIMSPQVSEKPPRINIWIKNLTPDQVLEHVTALGGLVMERKGTMVKVMTYDEYAQLYGIDKQVIQLKYANAKEVADILKPFAAKNDQARIVPDEAGNKVVLLVPKPLMESMAGLVKTLDAPFKQDMVKVVPVKYLDAPQIASALEEFLTEEAKREQGMARNKVGAIAAREGVELTKAGERWLVRFTVEPKLNVIVLRGLAKDVEQCIELITQLDIPSNVEIKSYELKYANVKEAFETLQDIVEEDIREKGRSTGGMYIGPQRLRIAMSEQNNRIIVEGSPEDQRRLAKIVEGIDRPMPPGSGGMRVYKLENSTSTEVAKVLNDLVEDRTKQNEYAKEVKQTKAGANIITPPPGQQTKAQATPAADASAGGSSTGAVPTEGVTLNDKLPPRITDAPEINAVIIKASASEHEEFSKIIHDLDKPRDQVVLEVTLVTIRHTTNFELGMELGGAKLGGRTDLISFSTFGIGTVDSATGQLGIAKNPPYGVNFAVINSDDFSLVLNALQSVGDTRIKSMPKVLVEDNTVASLSQINQEPYEVTSQGESSTVTSFGGYMDAGTIIDVRPHISCLDWLRLEYQINLSSFGTRTAQQLASNLPPPKRQATAGGTVRIPAEHMVVLGGLVGTTEESVVDGIPVLSDIPGVGELFKNRKKASISETLYIFIHPVILRDPAFRDLISLSRSDIEEAKVVRKEYPENPLKTFTIYAATEDQ